jgi:hypothetical protein
MNPYKLPILIGIACVGVTLLLGAIANAAYQRGKQDCESAQILKDQETLRKQIEQIDQIQIRDAEAARVQVVRETKFREIRVEVPTIVNRDVYVNVCADADGVRVLQAATKLANGETSERANGGASEVPGASNDDQR